MKIYTRLFIGLLFSVVLIYSAIYSIKNKTPVYYWPLTISILVLIGSFYACTFFEKVPLLEKFQFQMEILLIIFSGHLLGEFLWTPLYLLPELIFPVYSTFKYRKFKSKY